MSPEIIAILTRIIFLLVLAFGFVFCFLSVSIIGYVVIDAIRNPGQKNSESWYTLAEVTGLQFKPGGFINIEGSKVIGVYRNCDLKLETVTTLGPGIGSYYSTRLSLNVKDVVQSHPQLSSQLTTTKPNTVEEMVQVLAPNGLYDGWKGSIKAKPYNRKIYYEHYGIETDVEYLQALFDLLCDIADAYSKVMVWGGEVVPTLEPIAKDKNQLQLVVTQLLRDIGQDTTQRLSKRSTHLLCPQCLVRCAAHKVYISWHEVTTYYGCRHCRQSNEFLDLEGQVVTIFDVKSAMPQLKENEHLHVNWFAHGRLFDFDEVQIIHATDEDVERFAVQVGNDTDPVRKPKYAQMRCLVSPECGLSENTMRILRRTFGRVEVKQ